MSTPAFPKTLSSLLESASIFFAQQYTKISPFLPYWLLCTVVVRVLVLKIVLVRVLAPSVVDGACAA